MTDDKARKAATRRRMADTGEPYNVARRASQGSDAPQDSHLIGHDETRRIAESFLAASPWLGNVGWSTGIDDDFLGFIDAEDPRFDSTAGVRSESGWLVTFTDPTGEEQELGHKSVMRGLRDLLFGEQPPGVDGFRAMSIRQWFTEPAEERRKLRLSMGDCARICQQALYGRQVFRAGDELPGLPRFDLFEDQRGAQPAPEG
jgi:hypothetical protein